MENVGGERKKTAPSVGVYMAETGLPGAGTCVHRLGLEEETALGSGMELAEEKQLLLLYKEKLLIIENEEK